MKSFAGRRALITGGLGFVGSNLAHALVGLGAEVSIYDACLDPFGRNLANLEGIRERVLFVKGDIRDKEKVEETIKAVEPDLVFNCAAQVSHLDSMNNPLLDIDINCRGNMTVLEVCRKFADGAKIIYAGTRAQIGRLKYSPIDEEHPSEPIDVYGIDKLAAEKYHRLYNDVYGLRACSVVINNSYGPRHQMKHRKYGILNWFIRLALEGKEISVYGDGRQLRDYNYIDDVVDAMLLCAQEEKTNGQRYLLGSGKPIQFIEMVDKIIHTVGSGSRKRVPWPADREAIETGDFFVSFEKIKRELGWVPKTDFDEGLKKTVDFYKMHLQKYI
ncbi:MAG: SDR family NAD(P)-dependent oxidoreductase [Candidatus Aenigmarchaeota archaeon]|nr:SDR family NAD(P)-dependent oxidoreductase [Candidatus Aenigmarchaeota archaeon]MBI5229677.1 SDR family NAD(P)-dependent oxidoreductase [Candidatus Micrarchaeota archaeon]